MPPAPAAPAVSGGAKAAGYKPSSYGGGDPTFGPPTKADQAALKRRARQSDAAQRQHYESEDARADGAGGRSPGRGGATGPGAGSPRQARPTNLMRGRSVVAGGSAAEEGAGVLLGLVLYALLLSYVRYGPDGVRGWVAAKFLNKPYGPAVASAPPPISQGLQLPPSHTATPVTPPTSYPSPTTIPVAR